MNCPSRFRTWTLLIQNQACCQLHQGAVSECFPRSGRDTQSKTPPAAPATERPDQYWVSTGSVRRPTTRESTKNDTDARRQKQSFELLEQEANQAWVSQLGSVPLSSRICVVLSSI